MSMSQIGLLLELIGFFVISVFAGILLERGITNSWSDKVAGLVFSTASNLDMVTKIAHRLVILDNVSFLKKNSNNVEPLSSLEITTFGKLVSNVAVFLLIFILLALPIALICVALIMNIRLLLWIGIALTLFGYVIDAFITVIINSSFRREDYELSKLQSLSEFLKGFFSAVYSHIHLLVTGFIELLELFSLSLFLSCLKGIQTFLVLLSGKDALKKVLLVIGVLIGLTGLLVQFIATFN